MKHLKTAGSSRESIADFEMRNMIIANTRRSKSRLLVALAIACTVSVTAASASLADPAKPIDTETSAAASEIVLAEALAAAGQENGELTEPVLNDGILEFSTDGGDIVIKDSGAGEQLVVEAPSLIQAFSLGLPTESSTEDVTVLDDGTALFPGDDVDLAVQTQDDGAIRAQTIIDDSSASREFRYDLDLPEGAFAEISDDGGVDIFETLPGEKETILTSRFEPAWAVDANGEAVKTWYKIEDGALVQVVDHTDEHAYPVVADPFWIPAIIIAIRVGTIIVKVGSRTVKYTKAPASRVVNALSSFKSLSYRAGSHSFKLDKAGMKHILQRHHPKYWNGSKTDKQTFFNPNMSVNDVKNLAHGALKQGRNKLAKNGMKSTRWEGTYNGIKYKITVDKGRVVQLYPR